MSIFTTNQQQYGLLSCMNHIVSMLVSCVLDRGFETQSGKTKDYIISICCFSAKQAVRAKTGWLGIRIMYSSGATPDDSCFSELAL